MPSLLAPIAALLFSVALLQAGNGLQGTLLPVRADLESFSTFAIGILGSTYYAGFVGGCLLGPYLVKQVGHIRVFTAMAALASAAPLVHGLLLMPLPWWLLRVSTGFCIAVLFMVIESWLNERSTKQTRGSVLAVYLVINLTVVTLGQMLLTVYDPAEFILFAVASILVSVAAVPVALSAAPAPAPIKRVKVHLLEVFKISPVGFVACFAVGATNGAFWALAPRFAGASGLAVAGIAVFMSVTVLSGALGQWPIGKLSDRLDRRKVMLVVSLLVGAVGVALAVRGEATGGSLFALSALWGFLAFPMYGLAVAHANDYAAFDQFVEVSSASLLVYAAGAVVGPIVAATLMTRIHASHLYSFTAFIHFALALFVLWRIYQRAPVPAKDQVRFIDALEASQTVSSTFETELQDQLVKTSDEAAGGAPR